MKVCLFACLLTLSLFAESTPLQNGVFLGFGGSYNSVKVDQQLSGTEFSSVFSGPSLAALGESGGNANPYHKTKSTLAPQGQIGYLHRFSNSSWFLGGKAAYQYLGLTFTQNNIDSFPAGAYTAVGGVDLWTDRLIISSSQTKVDHELFLLPVVGYFFGNASVYLGAGPAVFGIENNLYGIRGSANVNGPSAAITGTPSNLSFSEWIWGGIAQLGMVYPFTSRWFLDLNYSYAVTGNVHLQDSVLFSNSLISNALFTEEGVASVKMKQRITNQSFSITINKLF